MTYFEVFQRLKAYYKTLTEAGVKDPLERAQGRLDAPLLFILPDFHSPFSVRLLLFLKEWFARHEKELQGAKFHQVCCLSYRKGNSFSFSNEVLSNELRCIQPQIICSTLPLQIDGTHVMSLKTIPYTLLTNCNLNEIEQFFETDGFRLEQELNQLFPLLPSLFA